MSSHSSSYSGSKSARQRQQMRQGSQRERKVGRPPTTPSSDGDGINNCSNDDPSLIDMRITTTSPTSVAEFNYDEEAMKAAEAIVYADQNNDVIIVDADTVGDDKKTNTMNNIDDDEIESIDDSTTDSQNGAPNSNRFEILRDCDSSSSSDSSGLEGNMDSNPFNVLMDDDSSSSSSSESSGGESVAFSHTDSEGEDGVAAKCAVCFLTHDSLNNWTCLVTLPCCGLEGKEDSSSTRFCAACLLQMAMTKYDPEISNEYPPGDEERYENPVKQFYNNDCQTDTIKFIDCPRCRSLLRVDVEKNDSDDDESSGCGQSDCSVCQPRAANDWTTPRNVRAITVQMPSFEERVRCVGKKVGIARILWRAAFLHHGFMPLGTLRAGDSVSDVHMLAGWGIIHKVSTRKTNSEIYGMARVNHMELIKILGLQNTDFTGDVFRKEETLDLQLLLGIGHAAFTHACEFRIDRLMRILNRCGLLLLLFKGYLPPFPLLQWQEWVVTGLNIFSVTLLLQFICIAIVYIGSFIGVGLTLCYALRRSSDSKSIWDMFMPLLAYFVYKIADFVFSKSFSNWFGLVVPKAVIGIKKIVWG